MQDLTETVETVDNTLQISIHNGFTENYTKFSSQCTEPAGDNPHLTFKECAYADLQIPCQKIESRFFSRYTYLYICMMLEDPLHVDHPHTVLQINHRFISHILTSWHMIWIYDSVLLCMISLILQRISIMFFTYAMQNKDKNNGT